MTVIIPVLNYYIENFTNVARKFSRLNVFASCISLRIILLTLPTIFFSLCNKCPHVPRSRKIFPNQKHKIVELGSLKLAAYFLMSKTPPEILKNKYSFFAIINNQR